MREEAMGAKRMLPPLAGTPSSSAGLLHMLVEGRLCWPLTISSPLSAGAGAAAAGGHPVGP